MSLSFVAYRDHSDTDRLEVLKFTKSVKEFKTFCGKLKATGGGDECEDVLGGLNAALGLNWSKNAGTKVIFHICDAPCHGKEFHNEKGYTEDIYPSGDPNGLNHSEIFSRLRAEGIQYHFGKINSTTDKMISVFSTAYGDAIMDFDVNKVDKISESVITAVSVSMSAGVTRTKCSVAADREERSFVLDKKEPDWKSVTVQKVKMMSYAFPTSIKSIIDDVPLTRSKATTAMMKIAEAPFAKGSERFAFYGMDVTTFLIEGWKPHPFKSETLVLKEYLHTGKGMNSARRYELSNQMQTIAAFLAEEYMAELKLKTKMNLSIRFVKIRTLSTLDGGIPRFMSAERRFSTELFVRFTNNVDYAIMEETAMSLGINPEFVQLVIAFSHWTYKATDRYLMVVDLEGVVEGWESDGTGGVVLTDPAIHCMDITRFGNMNHGKKGMDGFFRKHFCNKFCRYLNLEHFRPISSPH